MASEPQKPKENDFNAADRLLMKRIGLKIQGHLFKDSHPVEWLSARAGVARSTIREIIAGRSNPRLLTLKSIVVQGLGYRDVSEFLTPLEREEVPG